MLLLDVSRLANAMKQFAKSLGKAVRINAMLVDANDQNQIILQEELVTGYRTFTNNVRQYVPLEVEFYL